MSVVKRVREALGLTQQQMGDAIGVTQTAVANYESGVRAPKVGVAQSIRNLATEKGVPVTLEEILTNEPAAA